MSLLPVLRPLRCKNPDCSFPEGGRCARAAEIADPESLCDSLARGPAPDPSEAPAAPPHGAPPTPSSDDDVPWSGRHLDPRAMNDLLFRSPARVFGVLGAFNAGKTSLLTSFFLQLSSPAFPYRFAASKTLFAWSQLCERASGWQGAPREEILDHTPVNQEQSAFLHLGLRPAERADDRYLDTVFSDIPGEWLTGWAQHDGALAQTRLAFLQRCAGFILVADAAALLEPTGLRLDGELAGMLRRVAALPRPPGAPRQLALVFSKFDKVLGQVSPPAATQRQRREAWGPLGDRCRRLFTALQAQDPAALQVEIFPVSAFPMPLAAGQPIGVLAPFRFLLAGADPRQRWPLLRRPLPAAGPPFLFYQRARPAPGRVS